MQINFQNHLLPSKANLFPLAKPTVAEVFGVSCLIGVLFVTGKQAIWHGKPIESGFYVAFTTKGGYRGSYICSKYLRAVLSNFIVVTVLVTLIYSQGFEMLGGVKLLYIWIWVAPWFVFAFNNFTMIVLGRSGHLT